MTEQNTPGNDASSAAPADGSAEHADAKGIRAGLTEAQRAMLASKSRGGDAGLQSVGKSHKPTHASGKQGPAQKKVRW